MIVTTEKFSLEPYKGTVSLSMWCH